jgi:hypothetical protein
MEAENFPRGKLVLPDASGAGAGAASTSSPAAPRRPGSASRDRLFAQGSVSGPRGAGAGGKSGGKDSGKKRPRAKSADGPGKGASGGAFASAASSASAPSAVRRAEELTVKVRKKQRMQGQCAVYAQYGTGTCSFRHRVILFARASRAPRSPVLVLPRLSRFVPAPIHPFPCSASARASMC